MSASIQELVFQFGEHSPTANHYTGCMNNCAERKITLWIYELYPFQLSILISFHFQSRISTLNYPKKNKKPFSNRVVQLLMLFPGSTSTFGIFDGMYCSDKKERVCTENASISNFTPFCNISSSSNLSRNIIPPIIYQGAPQP